MERNMYASVNHKKNTMDQSDISYTIELLNDAITDKDWDKIYETRELLNEFLDGSESPTEE
jgi:hypothetical protein